MTYDGGTIRKINFSKGSDLNCRSLLAIHKYTHK